jgi:hypothetical protein
MFEHVVGTQCWGGEGGCARFYGSVSGGGAYRGFNLGPFEGGETQKNLRFVQRWNSTWRGARNLKGNYLTLGTPLWTQEKGMNAALGGFQLALSYSGTLYYTHGNGQDEATCRKDGYQCCPFEANCALGPGVAAAGPFMFSDYDNQWVAVELELVSTGVFRTYIWTRDGKYRGLYMEAGGLRRGAPQVTGFGGMYYHDSGAAPGSYVMVDEVVLSDSFIGPPAGFLDGAGLGSPPAPVNVRVVGY